MGSLKIFAESSLSLVCLSKREKESKKYQIFFSIFTLRMKDVWLQQEKSRITSSTHLCLIITNKMKRFYISKIQQRRNPNAAFPLWLQRFQLTHLTLPSDWRKKKTTKTTCLSIAEKWGVRNDKWWDGAVKSTGLREGGRTEKGNRESKCVFIECKAPLTCIVLNRSWWK